MTITNHPAYCSTPRRLLGRMSRRPHDRCPFAGTTVLGIFLCATLVGCTQQGDVNDKPGSHSQTNRTHSPSSASTGNPADADAALIERYRILVTTIDSVTHVEDSKRLLEDIPRVKTRLVLEERGSGTQRVLVPKVTSAQVDASRLSVEHGVTSSSIYYGEYRAVPDQDKEGKRTLRWVDTQFKQDLDMIRGLLFVNPRDGTSVDLFKLAYPVPVASADPPVPANWLLINAAPEAAYSLQIGYYEGPVEQRKANAVEAVRVLRKEGVAAFLHHGTSSSIVTVGEFADSAVLVDRTGKRSLAPEVTRFIERYGDAFMYNLRNGQIVRRMVPDETGLERRPVPQRSFLVKIPRD